MPHVTKMHENGLLVSRHRIVKDIDKFTPIIFETLFALAQRNLVAKGINLKKE